MLTLSRKEGQAIMIGDDVRMVVKKVYRLADGRHDVKLSFEAPRYVSIDREEVRERRIKTIKRAFGGNSK